MTPLTLLWTLSTGYIRKHQTRSLLIVLSIALGVATLVATQALNKGLKESVQEGVNPLANLADLLVGNGQTGVPADLAGRIEKMKLPGIASATPFVQWRIAMPTLDNKVVWLIGVDDKKGGGKDALASELDKLGIHVELAKLTWLEKGGLLVAPPALVSPNLARELTAAKHRTFELRNAGGTPAFTNYGTIDFSKSGLPFTESSVVVMRLSDAARVCFPEKKDYVHQINIKLEPGTDPAKAINTLTEALGDTATVQTVDANRQMITDVTAGLEVGLAVGGACALVVGMFLVYNALSVSVAERRHDIGILRSVGATRRQIASLFVGESFGMGLLGSALGLPLGWFLAWLAVKPMAAVISDMLVPIDSARIIIPAWLVGVALLSGTLVAVLASLVPALEAAGEEPADAVRRVPRAATPFLLFVQFAGVFVFAGAGLLLAFYRQILPHRLGMFAGVTCLFMAGLIATPILAALLGRVIQPLFRHLLGLGGRLAADNLVRAPGRTGIVIAALAATGGLLVQTAGFLKSTREAIYDWVEEKIAADLFVTCGSSLTSGGAGLSMDENLLKKLADFPGVETVLPVRFCRLDFDPLGRPHDVHDKKRIIYLVAMDTGAFIKAGKDRPLAQSLARFPNLREPGKVVVSDNFAYLYNVKVGDKLKLPADGKTVEVEVVGKVVDYSWNRGTIIMDRAWFREVYGDHQIDVFDLFLKPGADSHAVREDLMKTHGQKEALFIVDRADVHSEVKAMLEKVYSLAYAQQIVVGLVALLGVVSALFISVLQRRRELGLLRAVGATRSQILWSVLAEAILMGVIGAFVGFAIGLLLEWYVLDVLLLDESGFEFAFRVPWLEAGLVSVGSIVLATLAGLWPAFQATRLRIPEAIAYE